MSAIRRMMMRKGGKPKEYVDIKGGLFPSKAIINNSYYMYINTTERLPAGTDVHLSFKLSNTPPTLDTIKVSQTNAPYDAYLVATFYQPFANMDVEFTTTRELTYFGLFFSENVSLQVTDIVLEKII